MYARIANKPPRGGVMQVQFQWAKFDSPFLRDSTVCLKTAHLKPINRLVRISRAEAA